MDEKVVSLQEYREAQEPHLSGPARCSGGSWGTGYMEAEVVPEERWMCQCGCDIFRLSPTSILCVSCGTPVKGYP